MQETFVYTRDNVKIAVNHYQNGFDTVLIIAPGWFMTKDSKPFRLMSEEFSVYTDVITMDFRGHGKSKGCFTFTSKEMYDLNAVLEFAKKYYKKIFLMGFSLGAATSIITAAENKNIEKLIAVSAPSEFKKIENHWWQKEAWLPTVKKCEPKVWMSIRPGKIYGKKLKPIEEVNKITCPTMFIAGDKDPTVGEWHTKLLYEKAKCQKQFVEFENCCHAEDLYLQKHEKFVKTCIDWLLN